MHPSVRKSIRSVVLTLLIGSLPVLAADAPANQDAIAKIFQSAIANINAAKARQDAAQKRAAGLTGPAKAQADNDAQQAALDVQDALTNDFIPFVQYLSNGPTFRSLLSDLEQQRIDKPAGAPSATSGGTSPVSKGSVPSIFGFFVEHGGLTESTNNTLVTFQGNVANVIKAIGQSDYLKSWIDPNSPMLLKAVQHVTGSVTFDTSQGGSSGQFTGSTRQLAGASAHIDLYNKRDPRDPAYYRTWNTLLAASRGSLANSLNSLMVAIMNYTDPATGASPFGNWRASARQAIAMASPDQVAAVVASEANAFQRLFGNVPALQPSFRAATDALNAYANSRRDQLEKIAKSPTLAFEYTFTRQFPEAQTLDSMATAAAVTSATGNNLPNLSNVTLVGAIGFGKSPNAPELTTNFGATLFTNLPAVSSAGTIRDFRFSAEFDVPLRAIENIGTPTLSASYLLLDLLEKPLGSPVMVNGKSVGTTGIINLFQAKISISAGSSGVKIPISFTYCNRTELNTEADKRATIGVTYDFDSLFSKTKSGS